MMYINMLYGYARLPVHWRSLMVAALNEKASNDMQVHRWLCLQEVAASQKL